jgi:hypothetical protein
MRLCLSIISPRLPQLCKNDQDPISHQFSYTVKNIFYFDVWVTLCYILVAKGDMNERRMRITGLISYNQGL